MRGFWTWFGPHHVASHVSRVWLIAALAVALQTTVATDAYARDQAGALAASEAAAVAELAELSRSLTRTYDDVPHVSPAEVATWMKDPAVPLLLLDAREVEEYAVSHLPGAVQVDPDTWRWQFMSQFGERVRDKVVVIYCSVGVRSSRLGEHVADAAREAGARSVYNLSGGIFAWHNSDRPLVDAQGATSFVHPYDEDWGRLVARRELWRFEPTQ